MTEEQCPSFGNQELEDGQCVKCFNDSEKKKLFFSCNMETIRAAKAPPPANDQELPFRYNKELGRLRVFKGTDHTKTKQIVSWEMVKPCRGERCGAYDICDYSARTQGGSKCTVEKMYLKAVSGTIYRNYNTVLDEPTLMRVGLHLMPIYQNLCRLLITELGLINMIEEDSKGKSSISPVYKEIREHIKLLEQTWRSLGLTEYYIETDKGMPAFNTPPQPGVQLLDPEKELVVVGKKKPIIRGGG